MAHDASEVGAVRRCPKTRVLRTTHAMEGVMQEKLPRPRRFYGVLVNGAVAGSIYMHYRNAFERAFRKDAEQE